MAYLLGEPFGQTIGTEAYPVLGGETVYQVTNCKREAAYSNTNEPFDHSYENGACMICGANEDGSVTIIKQPEDASAKIGEIYCVEVIAQGDGLRYQWYFRNMGASRWSKSSVTDSTQGAAMN